MILRPSSLLLSALATVAISAAAHGQVIGIDFSNGSSTNQSPLSTDSVGPVASTGWNNHVDVTNAPFDMPAVNNTYHSASTALSLVDNSGVTTTGGIGFTQYGYNGIQGAIYNPGYGAAGSANAGLTPDQQLFNGAAPATPGGYHQEFTLSNIPYATYDLYVLVAAQDGAVGYPYPTGGYGSLTAYTNTDTTPVTGSTFWFYGSTGNPIPSSGFSYLQATGLTQGTATQGANYVEFAGLSNSGSVSVDLASPNFDGNAGAFITGVEIVNSTATIPEPATIWTAIMGLVGLVGFKSIKRNRI